MDQQAARERLLSLRRELTARHDRIDKQLHHRDERRDDDSVERASEASNDETMELLDENAVAELAQIDAALQRIDDGSYGSCEGCGQPIAAARLELLPFATRCVACAEQ